VLVMHTDPDALKAAVHTAVIEGAWSSADVVASVASDSIADRTQIVATLWDLVDEGVLHYDTTTDFPGFHPAETHDPELFHPLA